jgi:hypothetical protein
MEGANSATNWTVGCAENLTLQVSKVYLRIHMHIVKCALFSLLLGCPFQQSALYHFKDLPNGDVEVLVCDLANTVHRTYISTCPCCCELTTKLGSEEQWKL